MDTNNIEPVPVVLVGNKSDREEERQVTYAEGKKVKRSLMILREKNITFLYVERRLSD